MTFSVIAAIRGQQLLEIVALFLFILAFRKYLPVALEKAI